MNDFGLRNAVASARRIVVVGAVSGLRHASIGAAAVSCLSHIFIDIKCVGTMEIAEAQHFIGHFLVSDSVRFREKSDVNRLRRGPPSNADVRL